MALFEKKPCKLNGCSIVGINAMDVAVQIAQTLDTDNKLRSELNALRRHIKGGAITKE